MRCNVVHRCLGGLPPRGETCLAVRVGGGIDVDGDETVLDDPSWPADEAGAGSVRTDAGPMHLAS